MAVATGAHVQAGGVRTGLSDGTEAGACLVIQVFSLSM